MTNYRRVLFAAAAVGYVAVLMGNLLTRAPWVDEGYLANPAWNLAVHGFMGTTSIEMAGTNWTGIDRHTYNTLPIGILNLALWYRVFGFSLAVTRLPSLLWAAMLCGAIYRLLRALDCPPVVCAASVLFVAVDYNFMVAATFARVDVMCAALGFSAMAVYASVRHSHPARAVLLSGSLATLALFTHPNGIVFFPAVCVLEYLAFRMTLPWKTAAWGMLPVAVGGACWLAYVAQDAAGAWDQLRSNIYPGRLTGFIHPILAIRREVMDRYLPAYGLTLGPHPSPLVRARGLVLATYLAALLTSVRVPTIRSLRYVKFALATLAAFTLYLTFLEGTRFTYYIVLVTPLYATLLASTMAHFWRSKRKRLAMVVAGAVACMQIGGVVYRSIQNPYRKDFLPAVAFLRAHAAPEELVFADSAFSFGYGFSRNAKEEITFGYRSGIDPDYIVTDLDVAGNMNAWKTDQPQIYRFMLDRLRSYRRLYTSKTYQIYRKP